MKVKNTNVKIKEIAERLNLSSGTVSLVLNGRGEQLRISKETQKRVIEMAKQMHYQPNIYARRLRKSATEEVPYIIAVFWRKEFLTDLIGLFIEGLYQSVRQNNLNVELVIQPYDFGSLKEFKSFISSNRYNGAIIGGISDEDQDFLEQNDFDIPIVLIGRRSYRYNSVMIDDYDAGSSCAKLFKSREHKTAGLIGMTQKGKSAQLIELGFRETCKKENIRIDEEWIAYCDRRDFKCGYDAALRILTHKERPSALFVMDNRNAGGVFNACRALGINVPDNIEILVYGENEYFSYSTPTISSVCQPIVKYAEVSLNMVITLIDNKVDFPVVQELKPIFNFRESCGEFKE